MKTQNVTFNKKLPLIGPKMTTDYHSLIRRNADAINQLNSQMKAAIETRDQSPEKRAAWSEACRIFHTSYDNLVFPGGGAAIDRIITGDPEAMEAAICWLEVRPYFFRSGYHFGTILKKAKKAPLSTSQKQRLQAVIERQDEWRKTTPDRAAQGDVKAQVRLAYMYDKGQMVKQNPREAFKWFRKAAEQGHIDAQKQLCFKYSSGYGIQENYAEAYYWAALVCREGEYFHERDALARRLTPEQKAAIDKRVMDWKPTPASVVVPPTQ